MRIELDLTPGEIKHLLWVLEQAGEAMSNAGCNDMTIDNTPENVEFLRKLFADEADGWEDVEEQINNGEDIDLCDWIIVDYFTEMFEKFRPVKVDS